MLLEAGKVYANSTQEYYHPTKDEALGAGLAQVMRSTGVPRQAVLRAKA